MTFRSLFRLRSFVKWIAVIGGSAQLLSGILFFYTGDISIAVAKLTGSIWAFLMAVEIHKSEKFLKDMVNLIKPDVQ